MEPWDPDLELPIKLGPASNGEFAPIGPGPVELEAIRRTRVEAEQAAKRLGMDRRHFLRSLGGAAVMLGALAACQSEASKARGERPGGTFRVPKDAATEPDAAKGALAGDELVFDVQTHYLNFDLAAAGGFTGIQGLGSSFPQAQCGDDDPRGCFSVEHYLDLLFNQSDTDMVVLSAIPIPEATNPLNPADMELARRLATELCGDGRVLLHGGVQPTSGSLDAQLAGMSSLVRDHRIAAWKVYTHAPGQGWWLDDHAADDPQVGERVPRRASRRPVRGSCACTRASPAATSTRRPRTSARPRRRTPTSSSSCTTPASRPASTRGRTPRRAPTRA